MYATRVKYIQKYKVKSASKGYDKDPSTTGQHHPSTHPPIHPSTHPPIQQFNKSTITHPLSVPFNHRLLQPSTHPLIPRPTPRAHLSPPLAPSHPLSPSTLPGKMLSQFDHKWSLSSGFKSCAVDKAPYPSSSLSRPVTVADLCRIAIVTTYPPRGQSVGQSTSHNNGYNIIHRPFSPLVILLHRHLSISHHPTPNRRLTPPPPSKECGIATFSSMLEAGLIEACGECIGRTGTCERIMRGRRVQGVRRMAYGVRRRA